MKVTIKDCEETADMKHVTARSICMELSAGSVCQHRSVTVSFMDQNGRCLHVGVKISWVSDFLSVNLCLYSHTSTLEAISRELIIPHHVHLTL